MSELRKLRDEAGRLPEARMRRRGWIASIVWVVPLVAAIVAGYLIYDRVRQSGPVITIRFKDGSGVRPGQTPIKYRGVPVGEVLSVELSEDQRTVEVKARLKHNAAPIARAGAVFWIVRPEVGIGTISGLSTVITGPEIQALPGSGEQKLQFAGLESAPAALEMQGLRIVLRAAHLGAMQRNSPVYYRGIEVGVVQDIDLSRDATTAEIHVIIKQRYARLVRTDTVFWNASGASLNAGLFRGLEFKVESLKALAAGGVAFASAGDANARPAKPGAVFTLYPEPRKEWLDWAPQIRLSSDAGPEAGGVSGSKADVRGHPRTRDAFQDEG
jgi:paraquat-inducible protein B